MMNEPVQGQIVYQADPGCVQTVRSVRDRLHDVGQNLMYRHVRVQTMDGHVYEGTVVHIDGAHLHLRIGVHGHMPMSRGFLGPLYNAYIYNNVILPLVLYELLVITLLYT